MTAQKRLRAALVLLAALPTAALAAPAVPAPSFTLTTFPKGFAAMGINYSGKVVGTFDNAAAIWSKTDFVTLSGMPGGVAYAISHRGAIVGSHDGSLFINFEQGIRGLPPPPSGLRTLVNTTWPAAIDDADQVAGWAIGTDSNRGFLYGGGFTYQTIGTFSGEGDSYAQGMNNRGQVVGRATTGRAGSAQHAFLYDAGRLRDLGTLPGAASSQAFDMNERGQIVGDSGGQPFLYADGQMSAIGDPRDQTASARAINNAGWVVGSGNYAGGAGSPRHAFLYADGRNFDLGTRLSGAEGWYLEAAEDINDSGQILAIGCKSGTGCVPVLLDPVSPIPEPGQAWMLALGVALLIGVRKGALTH